MNIKIAGSPWNPGYFYMWRIMEVSKNVCA